MTLLACISIRNVPYSVHSVCRELTDGIVIQDAQGNELGKSKKVAQSAIAQVINICTSVYTDMIINQSCSFIGVYLSNFIEDYPNLYLGADLSNRNGRTDLWLYPGRHDDYGPKTVV